MFTLFRTLSLISILAPVALLGPATPGRATSETVITVNTTVDELNYDGDCSLREAIQAANTNTAVDACPAGSSGTDTIILPAGFYQLGIPPDAEKEDNAMTGDLDISQDLFIEGAGRDLSVIDGNEIDRVFHVLADVSVEIGRVTIQKGKVVSHYGGGGIFNQGTLTLRDAVLQDNQAVNVGGALDNLANATLFDVYISGNTSTKDGGGIFNNGQLFLYNSTLSGNTAIKDGGGGGLDNAGSATMENVTISGNTAPAGGGVFNDGELFVLNSSFLANTATDPSGNEGGNIENAGTVRIKNTIVANSLAGPNCAGSKPIVSEGNNLESAETCSFNDLSDHPGTDPVVGPLADNEGPTLTHALLAGSPAIDRGDTIDCPEKDQRGAVRPADGDGDNVTICDIGAFEYEGVFPGFVFIPLVMR